MGVGCRLELDSWMMVRRSRGLDGTPMICVNSAGKVHRDEG